MTDKKSTNIIKKEEEENVFLSLNLKKKGFLEWANTNRYGNM